MKQVTPSFFSLGGFPRVVSKYFCRVGTDFEQSAEVFSSFTEFYWALPSCKKFYMVLPSFTEFYRVLPSFTEFYRVLPSFIGLLNGIERNWWPRLQSACNIYFLRKKRFLFQRK